MTRTDERVTLDGTKHRGRLGHVDQPEHRATAGYTMNLTKTWTDVDHRRSERRWAWTGYPSSGTVQIAGSIERHRDGPSGVRTGSWSGTILITFDGDTTAAVDVNGSPYVLDLAHRRGDSRALIPSAPAQLTVRRLLRM